jgi:hypothetical protein
MELLDLVVVEQEDVLNQGEGEEAPAGVLPTPIVQLVPSA